VLPLAAMGAHVSILAGASQKLDVDECLKHCLRRDRIKTPQPLYLRFRQTQTGNLEILGAYELELTQDVRVRRQHPFTKTDRYAIHDPQRRQCGSARRGRVT
jgi:hypothetical protein